MNVVKELGNLKEPRVYRIMATGQQELEIHAESAAQARTIAAANGYVVIDIRLLG